jgi:hypothetical protein
VLEWGVGRSLCAFRLTVTDGTYEHDCLALVRVHTEATVHLPQILLDTDARNAGCAGYQ